MNKILSDHIEQAILSWPGVNKQTFSGGRAANGFRVPPAVMFRFGRRELGHIHVNGDADLPFPRQVHDELIAAGRARPHPAGFAGVVTISIRSPQDVPGAVELFRMNYDRAHAASGRREALRSLAGDDEDAPMPEPPSASAPADGPAIQGLFEMTLEVADLAVSERFYREVIGLPVADRWGEERPAVWLALGREGFLGLWPPETGGAVAIHGGRGGAHVHFALRLPLGTIDDVKARLAALGYETEERGFGQGNRALYLNDPDGNVLELTERRTLWDGQPATEPD